eukprot:4604816-Alexandrium_andersonii.AAC.1
MRPAWKSGASHAGTAMRCAQKHAARPAARLLVHPAGAVIGSQGAATPQEPDPAKSHPPRNRAGKPAALRS